MSKHLLIANRGECALRILRSARRLGWKTTVLCSKDDEPSLPARLADATLVHSANGPQAYLDLEWIVGQAVTLSVNTVHPGIGFLSEDARLAEALEQAGIGFVGPRADTLRSLGNKHLAIQLAQSLNIHCAASSAPLETVEQALTYWHNNGGQPMMLKAISGGGGRGIRLIHQAEQLAGEFDRARDEARRSFDHDGLYLEPWINAARHIEAQLVGDGAGSIQFLGLRDCSVQRRHQKLIEIAPPAGLNPKVEHYIKSSSRTLAEKLNLRSLATFEFLVRDDTVWFMEANPRLQIEHTLTEQLTGLDLVALQLQIGEGMRLADLGLTEEPASHGQAVELRINAEYRSDEPAGHWLPATGTVASVYWPGGPCIRVDSALETGSNVLGLYDSQVAKLVVSRSDQNRGGLFTDAMCALDEVEVHGLQVNTPLLHIVLQSLRESPDLLPDTQWFEQWAQDNREQLAKLDVRPVDAISQRIDGEDLGLASTVPGRLVQWQVKPGDLIHPGQVCAIVESMKMEHEVVAPRHSRILDVIAQPGDTVLAHQRLANLLPVEGLEATAAADQAPIPESAALLELRARTKLLADDARPLAIAKRHALGMLSARESINLLLDPESLREYGGFAIAAQRSRRSIEDLVSNTPADGLITGIGTVHADLIDPVAAQVAVMAYDYTVLAGTQGIFNHKKSDRLLSLARRHRLPVVIFAEGGGGRPGDVDWLGVAGLDCTTFWQYGKLSGVVPRIAIVTGRCFAGNAALAGTSDLLIATKNSTLGMGGPAMIEGAGLGVVEADAVGPSSVQFANGVIDVLCDDDREAIEVTRQIIGMLSASPVAVKAPMADSLANVIPQHRLRVYEVRHAIAGLVDLESFIELRGGFGPGVVTGLARVDGIPVGLMANNPKHLGGALDAAACEKLYGFIELMRSWRLPLISLCDTPGFMVGVDSEAQGMVRKASQLFNVSAKLPAGLLVVVMRKGYGLGAQAMAGGSFAAPSNIVAWPQAEFGAMGLEGATRLGFRKELQACAPEEREALFQKLLAGAYEKGKALNMASYLEIDHVIEPTHTRQWLAHQLRMLGRPAE